MQAPVDSELTKLELEQLLTAEALQVDAGLELLDADLQLVEQLDDDLEPRGSSVSRSCRAKVHGTCQLQLRRALSWGVDVVRPTMTLRSGQLEATWQLGAYVLTTPERPIGATPTTYRVEGFDRLVLLDRQIAADHVIAAGTTYYDALVDTFDAAGLTGYRIDGEALDYTLPAERTWPLVALNADDPDPDQETQLVTWLRIVNDLLRAINFRAVWCDDAGRYRCQRYVEPADRGVEWTFDTSSLRTIVGADRTLREDAWQTPNVWVFRNTNVAAPVEGAGIYTVRNDDADDPLSTVGRGLEWVSNVDVDAASQTALESYGDRVVASDRRRTSELDVDTGPMPGAGHFDVFRLVDGEGGLDRKVQGVSWQLPLDGGDMAWTWEAIT